MSAPDPKPEQPAKTSKPPLAGLGQHSTTKRFVWLTWLILFGILLEYILGSIAEGEYQAALLAGALFAGMLIALGIIQFMRNIEASNLYRYPPEADEMIGSGDSRLNPERDHERTTGS